MKCIKLQKNDFGTIVISKSFSIFEQCLVLKITSL